MPKLTATWRQRRRRQRLLQRLLHPMSAADPPCCTLLHPAAAQAVVATLGKEKPQGEFATLWRAALQSDEALAQVELAPGLGDLLAVKDTSEVACVKRASIFGHLVC